MNNIYYDPEKYGLSILAEIDEGGSYEFDMVVVFQDSKGDLWACADSGCSCPYPFENKGVPDLMPIKSVSDLDTVFDSSLSDYHKNLQGRMRVRRAVRGALRK